MMAEDGVSTKEMEAAFHRYWRAKREFLRIAERWCEQQLDVIEPANSAAQPKQEGE